VWNTRGVGIVAAVSEPARDSHKRAIAAPAAGSASLASLLLVALFGPTDAARSADEMVPRDAATAPADPCPAPDQPEGEVRAEGEVHEEGEVREECVAADAAAATASGPAPAHEVASDPATAPAPEPGPALPPQEPAGDAPGEHEGATGTFDGGDDSRHADGRGDGGQGSGHSQTHHDGGASDDRNDNRGDGDRGGKPNPDRNRKESGGASALDARIARPGFTVTPVVTGSQSPIPSFLLPIYQDCGRRYGVPWRVLAAINEVETAFGSNLVVSSAGAVGWMQFMPSTWSAYGIDADGDGTRDPYDPDDAICAAANYLRASGAEHDLAGALFAYNHADWYVEMVLSIARSYADIDAIDPLPRAKRLDPDFAQELARISRAHHADWALVLAVLRARGERGRTPATANEVGEIAARVAKARSDARGMAARVRSLFGRSPRLTREAVRLARYNRAVGLRGLVHGLNEVRNRLQERVLDSPRLSLYEGGRLDIRNGRVDPRVLTLLLYLAESHEELTVTSLITGHGYYARPGVPSAHAFGEAVDIAAIDGVPLLGNQQPGSVAERTLREIVALPKELQPAQVISLFEMGGPTFAAADHHDHIHVGY
jgi:Transglycosylase SLT domain